MEFFDPTSLSNLPTEYDDIAMTRGQARQLIDRFTQEAVKKNITPETFLHGLSYLQEVGKSPDFLRRHIRNVLKSPTGKFLIENPDLAKQTFNQMGGLTTFVEGVNPALAGKHMGLMQQVMEEARKDNLLRPNVTYEEIEREIQKPIYGALMDWTKTNINNPVVQDVLQRTRFGDKQNTSVMTWGPKGLVPLAVGFEPQQFGIKLTPEAQKEQKEYEKQQAWERTPQGQKQKQIAQQEAEKFRRFQKELDKKLNRK